jgi:hypothetical protein
MAGTAPSRSAKPAALSSPHSSAAPKSGRPRHQRSPRIPAEKRGRRGGSRRGLATATPAGSRTSRRSGQQQICGAAQGRRGLRPWAAPFAGPVKALFRGLTAPFKARRGRSAPRWFRHRGLRQGQVTPVRLRDPPAGGQAQPGSGAVPFPVQADQRLQHALPVLRPDALAVVRDQDRGPVVIGDCADPDFQGTFRAAVVQGVGEQILQQGAQLERIGVQLRVVGVQRGSGSERDAEVPRDVRGGPCAVRRAADAGRRPPSSSPGRPRAWPACAGRWRR